MIFYDYIASTSVKYDDTMWTLCTGRGIDQEFVDNINKTDFILQRQQSITFTVLCLKNGAFGRVIWYLTW